MLKNKKWIFAAIASIAAFVLFIERDNNENSDIPKELMAALAAPKPDFSTITDVKQKKQAFFDYLKPKVALENYRVTKERSAVEKMRLALDDGEAITSSQLSYAKRLAKLYSLPVTDTIDSTWLDSALNRINVIPPAMVLAQAANESAWGTSRFATEANNFFGQWCYRKGCGLVPLQRNEGATHEVAKFDSVQQSVHAYFMNINRNTAYKALRVKRHELASVDSDLLSLQSATTLIGELGAYSERGQDYITELRAMVNHNKQYLQ
ncbi:glucosaminidase domain-containing protein [Vibrio sp. SCSIO 43136]|uniref:glucosaminidase domain-containing protein n=1 Tax=Vibrio sp. SCSIO 43136 TaxID=2819101 RepID=UPI0020764602|nr:glucosaminidase domain-containing protein [Vibrio sp. SCSIO 43136]USD66556.1 glucosaminidase domain-containing protein [Vibrio sp. SCSIO 43136]